MRKLVAFNMVTLDGYFEGRHGDISWHRVDDEMHAFMVEQMTTTDTLLFGRKTYQVMEDFWPTKKAFEQDPEIAAMMGRCTKFVFSATKEKAIWENTKLIRGHASQEVRKLKAHEGKDMFVFGSGNLCRTLIKDHLIDEFRMMVNPVTLGSGNPFFCTKMDLQLLKARVFGNGDVLLCYRPAVKF